MFIACCQLGTQTIIKLTEANRLRRTRKIILKIPERQLGKKFLSNCKIIPLTTFEFLRFKTQSFSDYQKKATKHWAQKSESSQALRSLALSLLAHILSSPHLPCRQEV